MPDTNDSTTSAELNTHTALAPSPHVIGDQATNAVDGRKLHQFLEVGKDFSSWIKDRIAGYGFVEGVDYAAHAAPQNGGAGNRGARIEYALSLDMAKEVSMVERNGRGREARRYFIECERRAKAVGTIRRPATPRIDVSRECRLTMKQNLGIAKMIGLTGNQAALSANRATVALTGVDMLKLLGASHMDAPQPEPLLSPSDLGRRLDPPRSAQAVNQALCGLGLQHAFRDAKNHVYYEVTEDGQRAGGVMQDTGKRHSTGTPVRQLRWASSVLRQIEEATVERLL